MHSITLGKGYSQLSYHPIGKKSYSSPVTFFVLAWAYVCTFSPTRLRGPGNLLSNRREIRNEKDRARRRRAKTKQKQVAK